MSWVDILKAKKINMDYMRAIVDHILTEINPNQLAIHILNNMVVSTYKTYNTVTRPLNFQSILANMLQTRGYNKINPSTGKVKLYDDLSGQTLYGTFYRRRE